MNREELIKAIQAANAEIVLTPIRGKNYAEVAQRVAAFRKVYPNGSIETNIDKLEGGLCVMTARISDGEILLATGHAYEKETSSQVNKTSYIENCETSAVGRALGFCGFGVATNVASKEEVENADAQQEEAKKSQERDIQKKVDSLDLVTEECKDKTLTDAQKINLRKILVDYGIPEGFVLEQYGVKTIDKLTQTQGYLVKSHAETFKAKYEESK